MSTSEKFQILVFVVGLVAVVISFLVITNTIGNIGHGFDRIEEIVTKETILRLERIEKVLKIDKDQERIDEERRRRTEALLNVPLMRNEGKDDDE